MGLSCTLLLRDTLSLIFSSGESNYAWKGRFVYICDKNLLYIYNYLSSCVFFSFLTKLSPLLIFFFNYPKFMMFVDAGESGATLEMPFLWFHWTVGKIGQGYSFIKFREDGSGLQ